jgi:indolepyruvate ferredoxin oxidoreductase beta subunit
VTAERPITVLMGALGGQGGGVLADWMVEAARRSGYPAQATSTPGVAQRTGATTYYFELFPDKDAPGTPIFALFPSAGDVDLMTAMEPTEAGRALERGHITDTTTVITVAERFYSTAEKVAAGDGTIPVGPVLDALDKASKKLIPLTMADLAKASPRQINSIMFGAIAGSGVVPIDPDDCRAAISQSGVAVEMNLAGFEIGLRAASTGGSPRAAAAARNLDPAPAGFETELQGWAETLRPILGHALARLVDYQDAAYARFYLERLKRVSDVDDDPAKTLTETAAKRLAAWMSYEDVIRVAQLKTRPGRLQRIRGELGLDDDTPLRVTDYFKPGREEIAGLLPGFIADRFGSSSGPPADRGVALHLPTGTAFGYALLKILRSLRPLRRIGRQYAHEQDAIERWLGALLAAAGRDYALACRTAELSIWARGYGEVRRRGMARLDKMFSDWSARLDSGIAALSAEVDTSLILAHGDQDAAGNA